MDRWRKMMICEMLDRYTYNVFYVNFCLRMIMRNRWLIDLDFTPYRQYSSHEMAVIVSK